MNKDDDKRLRDMLREDTTNYEQTIRDHGIEEEFVRLCTEEGVGFRMLFSLTSKRLAIVVPRKMLDECIEELEARDLSWDNAETVRKFQRVLDQLG